VELAKTLVQRDFINTDEALGGDEIASKRRMDSVIALQTTDWKTIYEFLN
jgi:imidazoleglycerol-phosphate dehydratase/histidinol-phosphatase